MLRSSLAGRVHCVLNESALDCISIFHRKPDHHTVTASTNSENIYGGIFSYISPICSYAECIANSLFASMSFYKVQYVGMFVGELWYVLLFSTCQYPSAYLCYDNQALVLLRRWPVHHSWTGCLIARRSESICKR